MSTQHPDNANQPFFVEYSLIGGEDEILKTALEQKNIKEAQYAVLQAAKVRGFLG